MTPVQHFLNLTDDLICILNENGEIQEVNSNWKQLFQNHPSTHKNDVFMELVHDDYRKELKDFFLGAQRQVLRLPECRLIDNEGKNYWLDLKIRWIPDQGRYWCLLKDITKEKLKEEAQLLINIELSSFEKGLEQFSIVARTDSKGKITHANDEFCRISKYSIEELIGQDHRIVNSGHHSKYFFKEMWDAIKQGKTWRGEIKNKAKDGTFYWVDTIIIPICDTAGRLQETLSFRFEITELKQEQEQNTILQNKINLLTEALDSGIWSYDFTSDSMSWNKKMKELFTGFETIPTLDSFIRAFDSFNERDYELFLKDPACYDFQLEHSKESHTIILQLKLMRNYLGDPVRMDGVCSIKRKGDPEKSGSHFVMTLNNYSRM